ncbi:MAG: hypothetical protein LWW93_03185 [Hyphomicrobiales bacterium]|nr:hypothetical protein [Hyphomicrobiales bacterium]
MSSPETGARRRPLILPILVLGAAFGLAGCTTSGIRPLYGTAAGEATTDALRQVKVVSGGRIGQKIRQDLVFGFSGGAGEPDRPRWQLTVDNTFVDTAVGIDRSSNLATAHIGQITASWVLTEITTGRTLANGASSANAAYDYSQQRFADLRAQRDAQDRAAAMIALDIRTKIAVWFAENPNP